MNYQPIASLAIAEPARKTLYPEPFAGIVAGRAKRRLGDHFGLTNFGVNLTQLAPGDEVEYPNDDLKIGTAADGRRFAAHKDGTPY